MRIKHFVFFVLVGLVGCSTAPKGAHLIRVDSDYQAIIRLSEPMADGYWPEMGVYVCTRQVGKIETKFIIRVMKPKFKGSPLLVKGNTFLVEPFTPVWWENPKRYMGLPGVEWENLVVLEKENVLTNN